MKNNKPTPRTDEERKRQERWADEVHVDTYACWMETFKFAEELECELNEYKEMCEKLVTAIQTASDQVDEDTTTPPHIISIVLAEYQKMKEKK